MGAVWPAAGAAFAVIWRLGRRSMPALWAAGWLSTVLSGAGWASGALLSGASIGGAWLGCWVAGRYQEEGALYEHPRNVMLLFMGAALQSVFAATMGCVGFHLLNSASPLSFQHMAASGWGRIWWTWVLAEGVGVIVTAPLLLALGDTDSWQGKHERNYVEMALVILLLVGVGWFVIGMETPVSISKYPVAFAFTPVLIWATFRFSYGELFSLMVLCAASVVGGALYGHGALSFKNAMAVDSALVGGVNHPLLLLQTYILLMSSTTLIIKAVLTERVEKAHSLELTQDVAMLSLASLAETRDNETGAHLMRTKHYVRILAEDLKHDPRFQRVLTRDMIHLLFKSAPLHDIGKVAVPDAILLKPGRLTAEEFAIIQQHTVHGRESLRQARDLLGEDSFIALAEEIAFTHHEKWDGSGYPRGLQGESIPLGGRLMALADVYDALTTPRVYKGARTHLEAKEIILAGMGTHFDPDVVKAFIRTEHEFVRIAWEYADSNEVHEAA